MIFFFFGLKYVQKLKKIENLKEYLSFSLEALAPRRCVSSTTMFAFLLIFINIIFLMQKKSKCTKKTSCFSLKFNLFY